MISDRRRVSAEQGLPSGVVSGNDAHELDVVFSKNDGSLLVIISGQENWPDRGWTPIGIVVVPGDHARYNGSECGVMSLVEMDRNHPESGVGVTSNNLYDNNSIAWGDSVHINTYIYQTDIILKDIEVSQSYWGVSLPRPEQEVDTIMTYSSSGYGRLVTWPYQLDSQNHLLRTPVATNNLDLLYTSMTEHLPSFGCMTTYFNGFKNTVCLYGHSKYNNCTWDGDQISNSVIGTYNTPAAACCARFKTIGTNSLNDLLKTLTTSLLSNITNSVDGAYAGYSNTVLPYLNYWYLPATGELSYLPSRRFEINNVIQALNNKYGNVGTLLRGNYYSSVPTKENGYYSTPQVYDLNINQGVIYSTNPINTFYVRAFMRIN